MFHYGLCPLGLCPQVSNGISPSTGSGNSPAAIYALYRHKKAGGRMIKKHPPGRWIGLTLHPPGMVEKGSCQGLWCWSKMGHLGLGPWGGSFSATAYGHLIPYPYLERDFRLFKARVWSSDSTGQDRVVPRNFTVGSGSNGCNNFPPADRPPLHPPWLLL